MTIDAALAAAKAKATRRVAARHWEEFLAEMRVLGWQYTPEHTKHTTSSSNVGRRQWHPDQIVQGRARG